LRKSGVPRLPRDILVAYLRAEEVHIIARGNVAAVLAKAREHFVMPHSRMSVSS
jgi:hypothetical protein